MSGQNSVNDMMSPVNDEVIPPGEAAATRAIVERVEAKVRDAAVKELPARRDAHPKGHGCVKAKFKVLDHLPPQLRVGLFATPGSYDAWIRFSNGNSAPRSDWRFDARGMAIKLTGGAASTSTEQDFVLINHPVFFVRDVADYLVLESAKSLPRFFFPGFNPLRFRMHEFSAAAGIALHWVNNLLNIRYWSMSAYLFGDVACKYSVRPVGPKSKFIWRAGANFLRANLAAHLAERDAEFDFEVQRRTRPETMPIEDPTIRWDETDAPFVPVARITIPKQTFDSPEQMRFCEDLSFNPWNCLDAHRPLGGLNRLRRTLYDRISQVRHELTK